MTTETLPEAISTILKRKSVRHYSGEPVSRVELDQILRAAMAAPVAIQMIPWSFIVITDRDILRVLAAGLPFAKMLTEAGTGIVVCVEPGKAALGKEEFAVLDGACASQNILLAAEALGLGAVWTAVYPDKDLMQFVRNSLAIPDNIIPLNIIPIGHPSGNEMAMNKYNPGLIFWNKWPSD